MNINLEPLEEALDGLKAQLAEDGPVISDWGKPFTILYTTRASLARTQGVTLTTTEIRSLTDEQMQQLAHNISCELLGRGVLYEVVAKHTNALRKGTTRPEVIRSAYKEANKTAAPFFTVIKLRRSDLCEVDFTGNEAIAITDKQMQGLADAMNTMLRDEDYSGGFWDALNIAAEPLRPEGKCTTTAVRYTDDSYFGIEKGEWAALAMAGWIVDWHEVPRDTAHSATLHHTTTEEAVKAWEKATGRDSAELEHCGGECCDGHRAHYFDEFTPKEAR